MSTPYTCDFCHSDFMSELTDEEAIADAEDQFGAGFGDSSGVWTKGAMVACPICFDLLMRNQHEEHFVTEDLTGEYK